MTITTIPKLYKRNNEINRYRCKENNKPNDINLWPKRRGPYLQPTPSNPWGYTTTIF
jgi:hypothetical protein